MALAGASMLPLALSPITLGLALATFRRYRALGARLRRGPGIVATAVAAALLSLRLLSEGIMRRFPALAGRLPPYPITMVPSQIGEHVGSAILALWVIMALGGAWRPRPHPLDRLGRWLGAGWLLYLAWKIGPFWLLRAGR